MTATVEQSIVTTTQRDIERLIRKLIMQHCHNDSRERRRVVAQYLTNDLDLDEAQNLIDKCKDKHSFVKTSNNKVWYLQNEDLIIYIRDESSMDLNIIGGQFSHLTPPSLREKYDIPPPRH